jgi:hypothetical protein
MQSIEHPHHEADQLLLQQLPAETVSANSVSGVAEASA